MAIIKPKGNVAAELKRLRKEEKWVRAIWFPRGKRPALCVAIKEPILVPGTKPMSEHQYLMYVPSIQGQPTHAEKMRMLKIICNFARARSKEFFGGNPDHWVISHAALECTSKGFRDTHILLWLWDDGDAKHEGFKRRYCVH